MRSVYIELLPGVPYIPFLYPTLGHQTQETNLFLRHAFDSLNNPYVRVENDPTHADDLLIPHNFSSVAHRTDYLQRYAHLSSRHGKRVIVFAHGDSDAPVPLKHSIVFRTSLYRFRARENEHAMPAYAEDLSHAHRRPLPTVPVVGFCGWAGYKSFRNVVGASVLNAYARTLALLKGDSRYLALSKGITFRKRAIRALQDVHGIRTNFVIRTSYSGHVDTISGDPQQARKEYLDTITQSDFCLAVKGDGNYSLRLYEILSAGRIPVLFDTECVLPLEQVIDYPSFLVRVDFRSMHQLGPRILDFVSSHSEETWKSAQKKARDAFAHYLHVPSFFQHLTNHIL